MPVSRLSQAPSLSFGSHSTCVRAHIQSINEMLQLCLDTYVCVLGTKRVFDEFCLGRDDREQRRL